MRSDEMATALPQAEIHDRGRGPEIKGTRITVYSVLDCMLECWPPDRIATWFNITLPQVEAAVDYIREHTIEVLTNYIKILERSAAGNPPDLQARLDAGHEKFQELVRQVRQVKSRADEEIQELIRQHREARAKEREDAGNHGGQ